MTSIAKVNPGLGAAKATPSSIPDRADSSRVRLRPGRRLGLEGGAPSSPMRPEPCWPLLERQASDELERARGRDAVDGAESVALRQRPRRVVRQVGDGRCSVRLVKFTVLLTPVNWTVSSRLKMSSRISVFIQCPIGKFFDTDRSILFSGGLRAKNRGVSLPLLPGCGGAKHSGLAELPVQDRRYTLRPGRTSGRSARSGCRRSRSGSRRRCRESSS